MSLTLDFWITVFDALGESSKVIFSRPPQRPRILYTVAKIRNGTYVCASPKNIVSRGHVESWKFVDVYSRARRQKWRNRIFEILKLNI